jgi:hypothetical protein
MSLSLQPDTFPRKGKFNTQDSVPFAAELRVQPLSLCCTALCCICIYSQRPYSNNVARHIQVIRLKLKIELKSRLLSTQFDIGCVHSHACGIRIAGISSDQMGIACEPVHVHSCIRIYLPVRFYLACTGI